jgi:hypothetical protein
MSNTTQRAADLPGALAYLNVLIARGVEYPDAHWQAIRGFRLSTGQGEQLQALYDQGEPTAVDERSADSLVWKVVEYQTSRCDFFEGFVVAHDEDADRIEVVDLDDATRWQGSEVHIAVVAD